MGQHVLRIEFSPDATFGDTQPTKLFFKSVFQTSNGCTKGIPRSYALLSLPLSKPDVVFTESALTVPL
jgi:hypothetical protein